VFNQIALFNGAEGPCRTETRPVSTVKLTRRAICTGARLPQQEHRIPGYRWRGVCAAWVFVVFGTQGCASAPAQPSYALTELASFQRGYEAPSNIVHQATCDWEADEVEPLAADRDDDGGREPELADQITRYLNDHCFPLVRASAGDWLDNPEIIIYGFVASDSGKRDAKAIADALLANTLVRIRDAVLVRPEMPSTTVPNSNADDGTGPDFSGQTTYHTSIEQYQRVE